MGEAFAEVQGTEFRFASSLRLLRSTDTIFRLAKVEEKLPETASQQKAFI